MPFLHLTDFNMHYTVRGQGSNTLVLVHGNVASLRWWNPVLAGLPAGMRAVAMDLRGCGDSGHPDAGYSIDRFSEDIHQLVLQLNLAEFHLVGHSMGGLICAYYTLQHPERVRTLTLVDSVPMDGLGLDDAKRAMFELLINDREVLRRAIGACMQYSSGTGFAEQAFADASRCAVNIYRDNPETMNDTNLMDRMQEIGKPVMLIHGQEDLIIPLEQMAATIEALPQAHVHILERCGHSPQIEKPAEFMALLWEFLHKHSVAGQS